MMKLASELSKDKLRGGFYTPPELVSICLDRVRMSDTGHRKISVLEPSCGDGAFLRGAVRHPMRDRISRFSGIELIEEEARKCQNFSRTSPFDVKIHNANTLDWINQNRELFDVVVGNPPFVRYQFVPKEYLRHIATLGSKIGVGFRGVSNLWIPLTLGALSRLKVGGFMSLVVPTELFTGLSAGDARLWLLRNFKDLQVDVFEPKAFPNVLQEVIVISGTRTKEVSDLNHAVRTLRFLEHNSQDGERKWTHTVPVCSDGWTKYLLTPKQLGAFEIAKSFSSVQQLGNIARLEVSIVTGANSYFSVDSTEIEESSLGQWAKPLLPRSRYAKGLVYNEADHKETVESGVKSWLLHFDKSLPDPLLSKKAKSYIELGESQSINKRYKTSIRFPWYRVPSVWSGKLLLSKRAHIYPQLIFNEADVLTTDTIYRGNVLPMYRGREKDLVASFHNSLTMLSVEIEGRSFGGGVLELVPSEISRLLVPFSHDASVNFVQLDQIARNSSSSLSNRLDLIEATDRILSKRIGEVEIQTMDLIRDAWQTLLRRRLSRN